MKQSLKTPYSYFASFHLSDAVEKFEATFSNHDFRSENERDERMSEFSTSYIREIWFKLSEVQIEENARSFAAAKTMYEQIKEKEHLLKERAKMDFPKKPRTAFILYCKHNRKDVIKRCRGKEVDSKQITKKLANEWKTLSEGEKESYRILYREERTRYIVRKLLIKT